MKLQTIIIQLFLLLFVSYALSGQESTVNYLPTSVEIANPERGWYHHTQTRDAGYSKLKAQQLADYRENENVTLILRLFYLDGFVDQENISEEYLTNMQSDFDSIRAAGIKCIVRFAYSSNQNAEVWDATPEIVFSHIEALTDVLQANSDVIAVVQAGFIGVWGEWYYTKNFAGMNNIPDETDQQNRRLLVEKLLGVFPENIVVQGRTPAIMKNIVQTVDAITEEESFDGSIKSRVGHHNDCFLANASDYGTYTNIDLDISYLNQSTKYTIAGGETCDGSNQYSDCDRAAERIKELHWTYLNKDYNKTVLNKWKDQGCFNEINLSLGYRIYLTTATLSDSVSPGSNLNLSLTFNNVGYAAPTQYKPIQLVLTHTENKSELELPYTGTNDDVRYWLPGEIKLDGQVLIPSTLDEANYSIGLQLPDQDENLAKNAAYSIQLANAGLWDADNGQNSLNIIVSVGNGGMGSLPNEPTENSALALSKTEIQLSWIDNSNDETGFELMRSVKEDNNWVTVTQLDANSTSYIDEGLLHGTQYNYSIRSVNIYGPSTWSNIASEYTLGVSVNLSTEKTTIIYPNPLSYTDLLIQFTDYSEKQITVNNLAGKELFVATTTHNNMSIPNDLFAPGIFIINIKQIDKVESKKLIVY